METGSVQLSASLESVSRALAQWAVNRHVDADPQLPRKYGADWRADWAANAESLITYLAQAVAVRRPALFTQMMRWNASAFEARGADVRDFVEHLRHLRAVVDEQLPDTVREPALACLDAALAELDRRRSGDPFESGANGRLTDDALRYLDFVLQGDSTGAQQFVIDRAQDGAAVDEIYERVLQPAQAEIGRLWHRGQIGVADEHFATATTQFVLTRLRPFFPQVRPIGKRVATVGVGGDFHEVGIRLAADFFAMNGWDVVYLGANMPPDETAAYLSERPVHILAVSASTGLHVRAAGRLIEAVRAAAHCQDTRIIVGGPPFDLVPDLWQELGADAHARSAREAVELARRMTT